MRREIRAIYEHGVLRPIEPLELEEQQRVRVTIDAGDPLADALDTEFMEWCARKSAGDVPSITAMTLNMTLLGADLLPLVFVASDARLCEAAQGEGLSTENPNDH